MKRLLITLLPALLLALAAPPGFAQAPPPGAAPAANTGDPPARVGRIAFIDGKVDFHSDPDPNADWAAAELNFPVTPQSAIWTEAGGRAEIELGHARIQLDSGTELVVTTLDDRTVTIGMPQGRADIDLPYRGADERYSIVTPRGTVDIVSTGHYRVIAGSDNDPTRIAVFDGAARFDGGNGSSSINPGSEAVISGAQPLNLANAAIRQDDFDAWSLGRDRKFDTAARSPDYIAGVTGYEDLAPYGSWSTVPDYGAVWYPNDIPSDWTPYSDGRWAWIAPWGWTWIAAEPWGFAPFHYGRWAYIGNRWGWVPGSYGGRAVYAPALVSFVADPGAIVIAGSGPMVGWIPLAPGEIYRPHWAVAAAAGVSFGYFARLNAGVPETRLRGFDHDGRFANRGDAEALRNARFATVVNRDTFVNADPVRRGAVRVNPNARIQAAATPQQAALPAPTPAARTGGAATTHRERGRRGEEARPTTAAPAAVANAPLPPTNATPRGVETNRARRPAAGAPANASPTPNATPQRGAARPATTGALSNAPPPPTTTPPARAATERRETHRPTVPGGTAIAPAAPASHRETDRRESRPPTPTTATARPPTVASPARTAETPRTEPHRPTPPTRPIAPAATPPAAVHPEIHRPTPTAPAIHPVAPATHPAPPPQRQVQAPHPAAAAPPHPAARPPAPAAKPAVPATAKPAEEKKPE